MLPAVPSRVLSLPAISGSAKPSVRRRGQVTTARQPSSGGTSRTSGQAAAGARIIAIPGVAKTKAAQLSKGMDLGGAFIFSQRHPLRTANPTGSLSGPPPGWSVRDYFSEGPRDMEWCGKVVRYYHRTVQAVVSDVLSAGFLLSTLAEPSPSTQTESTYKIEENISSPAIIAFRFIKPT